MTATRRALAAAGAGALAAAWAPAAGAASPPAVAAAVAVGPSAQAGAAATAPVALTTRSSGTPVRPRSATLAAQAQTGRRIVASGRIGMPAGLSLAAGCSGRTTVAVRRSGAVIASRTAAVSRTGGACRWRTTLTLPSATPAGVTVAVRGRFGGNGYLRAASTPVVSVTTR